MKTSELTDRALDWAVNQIEECCDDPYTPLFSTDWSQGGPIIEREFITCGWDWNHEAGHMGFAEKRNSVPPFHSHRHTGPTILVAAMRCYVASRLGNEVNIPEELE